MMDDKRFPQPVEVGDEAHPRRVATAWEAIEWLAQLNPSSPGPKFRAAMRICRDALDGWVPVSRAWQAVKDAANELGHTHRLG